MTMREIIKRQILDLAEENGVELTDDELRSAMAGVEYCVSECMADSVQDALSNVQLDRESKSDFPKDMPESFKNFINERSF